MGVGFLWDGLGEGQGYGSEMALFSWLSCGKDRCFGGESAKLPRCLSLSMPYLAMLAKVVRTEPGSVPATSP